MKYLGFALMVSPLIGISVLIIRQDGMKMFFAVWGSVLALIVPILLGLYILSLS